MDRRAHDQVGWVYFNHQPEVCDALQLLIAGWSGGIESNVPRIPCGLEQKGEQEKTKKN